MYNLVHVLTNRSSSEKPESEKLSKNFFWTAGNKKRNVHFLMEFKEKCSKNYKQTARKHQKNILKHENVVCRYQMARVIMILMVFLYIQIRILTGDTVAPKKTFKLFYKIIIINIEIGQVFKCVTAFGDFRIIYPGLCCPQCTIFFNRN